MSETRPAGFVEVAGRVIRHVIAQGTHDPLVLVHGFGGHLGAWVFNLPVLAAGGRTVAALDLPGHGRSSRELASGALEELSATLLAYLDVLEFARVDLVGHSMGAAVCLDAALRAPERVRSLTLLSPAGLGSAPDVGWARRLATSLDPEELGHLLRESVGDPGLITPEIVEDVLRYKRIEGTIEAQVRILDGVFRDGDVDSGLRRATDSIPTLVIWGDRDIVIPAVDAKALQRAGLEYHLLPACGHQLMIEAAPDVNRLIDRFVGCRS